LIKLRISPLALLSAATIFGLLFSAYCVFLASQAVWHNIDWRWRDGAAELTSSPLNSQLSAGARIVAISDGDVSLALEQVDFTEEPDGNLPSYTAYRSFTQRQSQLATLLQSPQLKLIDDAGLAHPIGYQNQRPLSDLPAAFWVQIFVGLAAWLICSAVGAYKTQDASARYLVISGGSTLLFASLAAIYSTRELAIDGQLFRLLSDLNFLGGMMFAATLVCVLWHYPKQLGSSWVPPTIILVAIAWFALQQLGAFESMIVGRRLPVLLALLASFTLSFMQWRNTRGDPIARAALQWFLLSWLLTSTVFSALIFLPQLLGFQTGQLQGYSFLLFLILYLGLALGISRFRLFGLGKWWLSVLSTLATLVILFLVDLLMVAALQLKGEQALSLSVIAAGLTWLPVRNFLWRLLKGDTKQNRTGWFGDIIEIAFASNSHEKDRLWQTLLTRCFNPLYCEVIANIPAPRLSDNGLILALPGSDERAALAISYAQGGKRLFSPEDLDLAAELLEILAHAEQSRDAYQRGVDSERARIAQDLHDNIGASLLAGLHRKDLPTAQASIRSAINEMRTIVNGLTARNTEVEVMLADLRYECERRLNDADITLNWVHDAQSNPLLPYVIYQNYVSIIREIIANVINHSEADTLTITVDCSNNTLVTHIEDNGIGLGMAGHKGHGLLNIQRRINQLEGELSMQAETVGTATHFVVPLPSGAQQLPRAKDIFNASSSAEI